MHANARLTPLTRIELVEMIESGVPVAEVARRFRVSRPTAYRWRNRARCGTGTQWWQDRSSCPLRSPGRIDPALEQRIVELRRQFGISPTRISPLVGIAASTIWRVLVDHRLNRKPPTPQQLQNRYERDYAGELIHIDIKRAGRIPDGGGRRVRGIEGYRTEDRKRQHTGHVYFHAAVDDHSRLAYVEVRDGQTAADTAAFLTNTIAWFDQLGIKIQQVMTDNAKAYVQAHAFDQALGDIEHITTRPYRPQTNGKVERWFRTLKDEYMYAVEFLSEPERRQHLDNYLHYYNWHRNHTSIGNKPPITRVNNLPEQHR